MKKLIIAIFIILPGIISAQQTCFNALFERYTGEEGYTTVEITEEMINVQQQKESKTNINNASLNYLKGIKCIKTIVTEFNKIALFNDVEKIIQDCGYKLMSTVNESGSEVKTYSIERNGKVVEFMMVVYSKEKNAVVNISGNDINVGTVYKQLKK